PAFARSWHGRLLALLFVRVRGPQTDAHDHELGGLDWRDTDHANQSPAVDVCLHHRRTVALDEERFLYLGSLEPPVAPHQGEEVGDRAPHACPQRLGIGLEHHPLQTAVDRGLDEDQQPPHVHVFPIRVARYDASAEHANAAVVEPEIADHIDIDRIGIEDVVL